MAHLAARHPPDGPHFAGRERREVVVQHEGLGRLVRHIDRVDPLLVAHRPERDRHERLGLAAREQRRAMGPRQHAHLAGDRPHGVQIASVDALPVRQHLLAHRPVLDLFDHRGDILHVVRELGRKLLLDRRLQRAERLRPLRLLGQVQRLLHPRLRELLHPPHLLRRRLDLGPLHLRLAHVGDQLVRGVEQLADPLLRHLERLHDLGFGELEGAAFDHHDRVARTGDDDVQVGKLELLERRVQNPRAFDPAHPHGRDRPVPGHFRDHQGGRRGRRPEHIGVVLLIRRKDVDEDLDLVLEAVGKQRPNGAVDHPGGQDLLVRGPPLAFQEPARDLPGGIALLAVLDLEGKEREGRDVVGHGDRGQHHRLAELQQAGSRRLFGQPARFQLQGPAREIAFDVLHHIACLEQSEIRQAPRCSSRDAQRDAICISGGDPAPR